jgi:chromatin remodeling complex protein RSC6
MVFKTDRVHMFTMSKLLSEHLQEKGHDIEDHRVPAETAPA